MANATNDQIQKFVDSRTRPTCDMVRTLKLTLDDHNAMIDDVYAALNQQSPTWTDTNPDNPAHLMTPADVLAINAFAQDIRNAIANHAAYGVVLKACARPVQFLPR
jgi:outer membrane PBP1 activator LpoA protein